MCAYIVCGEKRRKGSSELEPREVWGIHVGSEFGFANFFFFFTYVCDAFAFVIPQRDHLGLCIVDYRMGFVLVSA